MALFVVGLVFHYHGVHLFEENQHHAVHAAGLQQSTLFSGLARARCGIVTCKGICAARRNVHKNTGCPLFSTVWRMNDKKQKMVKQCWCVGLCANGVRYKDRQREKKSMDGDW